VPGQLPWTEDSKQHPLVQEQVPVLGLSAAANQGMPAQTEREVELSKEELVRAVLTYQQADDKAKLLLLTDPKTTRVMMEAAKFFMT